ncbi:MAG: hypothetical protein ACO1OB_02000 [Archangium sp.]
MSRQQQGLGRAALFGLFAGLLGGALVLGISAIRNVGIECEFPGTEECALETQAHDEIARLQLYASGGMALVAIGLFLTLRRKQAP